MPRTNLSDKEHKALVRACGGVIAGALSEAVLANKTPRKEMGNVGVELKIAAIRAHYRVA